MRNHPLRIGLLVFGLLVGGGCQSLTPQELDWLDGARADFEAKRYERTVEQLALFIDRVENAPELADAYYLRGIASAKLRRRRDAYDDLNAAIRSYPNPEVQWKARVTLGVMLFEDRRWSDASIVLRDALDRMPRRRKANPLGMGETGSRRNPTPYVLYLQGLSLERSGAWSEALVPFERITRDFPNSPQSETARLRLRVRPTHFAVQCGVFGRANNADQRLTELQRAGFRPYLKQEPRGRKLVNVVLVGQYRDYQQALRELARVKGFVPDAVLWPS